MANRIELLTFKLADVAVRTQRLRADETVTPTTFSMRYAAQRVARPTDRRVFGHAKEAAHGRLARS